MGSAWRGKGEGRGEEGLAASRSFIPLQLFRCPSCLAARAVTAKDTSRTAPKRDCVAREKTAGPAALPRPEPQASMPSMPPRGPATPRKAAQCSGPSHTPAMPAGMLGTQPFTVTCYNSEADGRQHSQQETADSSYAGRFGEPGHPAQRKLGGGTKPQTVRRQFLLYPHCPFRGVPGLDEKEDP